MTAENGGLGDRPAPAFVTGDVLAGRFRIARFLAQGGMGEVYEAEDLELRTAVALKTIRLEIAGEEQAIERFRREILLARRVTHPNVCRIFDVFRHTWRSASGVDRELIFLSMELLRGETLAARLRREGRLSTAEALPIAVQMSAALAAAHTAGIVHRDFKSANVVLVPGDGRLRAVVTDFGLARAQAGVDSSSSSLTGSGGMVGTTAYMAPEQVEDGEITSAADVYALGVVLYETVTGAKPFVGDSPFTTALKRLTEPPPSPRSHVPDLDPAWEDTILRCLARDPAERLTASDVAPALRGERSAVAKGRPRRRRPRLLPAALALAILLPSSLSFIVASRWDRAAPGSNVAPGVRPRRSVALMGFKNLSGRADTAWVSTAFSEMLSSEVAAGGKLRTIPGENVARMKNDLSLADAESLSAETLDRVRRNIGADLVIVGSYLDLGPQSAGRVRLDLRIQDSAAGETVASLVENGTEAELFELISRVGARLREQLGVELSAGEAAMLAAALPSGPEAERFYAEGLARLRVYDAAEAKRLLEKAVAADPGYALAHSALAEAWGALGYRPKAVAEAKRAFDLSGKLPREQRLWVEARYREMARHWKEATRVYAQLAASFPDNLDYGLRRAVALTAAGDVGEALAVIASLRQLPGPAAEDARIDLTEASAHFARSDFKKAQAIAARAAEKGVRQGARSLVAAARYEEGRALQDQDEHDRAVAAFEESRRLHEQAGNRAGAAWSHHSVGISRWMQGDTRAAERIYEEARAVFSEIGDRRGSAATSNTIAILRLKQGRLLEAQQLWEETLAWFRGIGEKRNVSLVLNNLASAYKFQGELARAAGMYGESLAIAREIGEKASVSFALGNLADLAQERGDLPGALRMYEDALAIDQEIGQRGHAAGDLRSIAEIMSAQGRMAEARSRIEQEAKVLSELRENFFKADNRIAAARFALEEGRLVDAEAAAREAIEAFARQGSVDDEAKAWSVLARALIAAGHPAQAQEAVGRATALSSKTRDPAVRLAVAITAGRARALSRRPSDMRSAMRALESSRAEARRAGRVGLEFDAELALAEVELAAGQSAMARSRLGNLEKKARTRGFELVAGKAARLAAAPL
jgi:serine/threonine protein kinase/tetratricopeptide (TPR) repeat protein